jgi:hypothetical protein
MKKATRRVFALSLVFLAVGCEGPDSPDSVMADALKITKKAGEAVRSIKNKETAAEAKTKLEQAVDEMEQVIERAKTLGPLDKEKFKNLTRKFGVEMKAARRRVVTITQGMRSVDPEDNVYLTALRRFDELIKELWDSFRPS